MEIVRRFGVNHAQAKVITSPLVLPPFVNNAKLEVLIFDTIVAYVITIACSGTMFRPLDHLLAYRDNVPAI